MTGIRKIQCLALGSMLAFSTVSLAGTKNESSQTTQPTTETEANVEQVNNTAVSTAHNPKLDAMLRKTAETAKERESINNIISTVYAENGLFAGSALVQHEIDRRNFLNFLKGSTNILRDNNIAPDMADKFDKHKEDFDNSVHPYAKDIFFWMRDEFSPEFHNNMPQNQQPSYEEVKNAIDDMVHNDKGLTKGDRIAYNFATERFTYKLKNPDSDQAKSLDVAYRTYYYDKLKFVKKAEQIGMRGEGFYRGAFPLREWLETTSPKAE